MSNEYERVDLVDTHHYCEVNQYGLVEFKIEKKDSVYMNENDYEMAQIQARANSYPDNKNKDEKLKGSLSFNLLFKNKFKFKLFFSKPDFQFADLRQKCVVVYFWKSEYVSF
jgi:hypothetical protein